MPVEIEGKKETVGATGVGNNFGNGGGSVEQTATNNLNGIIDFFNNGLFTIDASDVELQKYVDKINKTMQDHPKLQSYKCCLVPKTSKGISPISGREFDGLGYSSLVFYHIVSDIAYCYICLMGKTGRASLTAKETMDEVRSAGMNINSNKQIDTYTYADCINSDLYAAIDCKIAERDPQLKGRTVVATNIITPEVTGADENTFLEKITLEAISALQLGTYEREGKMPKLSQLLDKDKGELELRVKYIPEGVITNSNGEPVKADAMIELWYIPRNHARRLNGEVSFNNNASKLVVSNAVYISGIMVPTKATVPTQTGMFIQQDAWGVAPHIIRTSFSSPFPSLATSMLGMAMVGQFASNRDMVMDIMIKKCDKNNTQKPTYENLGVYNVISRTHPTSPDNTEFGGIKFDNKHTLKQKTTILSGIFNLNPYISDDIVEFGENSISNLTVIKSGLNAADKQKMLEAYASFTGYTIDLGANDPVYFTKTLIPGGVYPKNNRYYDLRDVFELGYIMDKCNGDINKESVQYAIGVLKPETKGVGENYDQAIKLLEIEAPNAKINHKVSRITYSNKYLQALNASLAKSGFIAKFEGGIKLPVEIFTYQNFQSYADQGLAGIANLTAPVYNVQAGQYVTANQYRSNLWL